MMYRPEGWNNPYTDKHEPHSDSWERLCFERGADAMLEALRKKPIFHVFSGGDNDSGDLVFIPDDTP